MTPPPTSLYIHIPFCESLCPYCDFAKVYKRTGYESPYIQSLLSDIIPLQNGHFKTIYIGGGTPSCLDFSLLKALLEALSPKLSPDGEFTFEANPESLSEEKIALLSEAKVNRVSMGVQSSLPKYLSYLGRKHDMAMVEAKAKALRSAGIDNINLDLMYGFLGQTKEELSLDLEAIISLHPAHISTYALQIEPGTLFFNKKQSASSDETLAEFYEHIVKVLQEHGYGRYEVSNFALSGKASRHNLAYWHDERYIGLGAGASGFEGGIRYTNTASVPGYIAGERRAYEEKVDDKADRTYYLLTHLRLEEGFSLEEFESRFHENLLESKKTEIKRLLELGLLQIESGRMKVHPKSFFLMDEAVRELI